MSSKSDAASNAKTAGSTAAGYGSSAAGANAALTPFYKREMNAEHAYDPTQTGELLTAAESGVGAAAGDVAAKATGEAARTHNASGFTKSLDELARDKMKANAGVSEGVAAQDVLGAKQLNQQGAAGMQGLYGTDVNGQMSAMGLQAKDTSMEDPGFMADLNTGLQTAAKIGSAAFPKGFQR